MSIPLELNDIQGTVLRNRPMPYYGSYLLFEIVESAEVKILLKRLIPHITSAADWSAPSENAWINVVFTYQGFKKMGIPEDVLKDFPLEFQQGMAARSALLGDVGKSDPKNWDMPHGENGFHIGLYIMAGSEAEKDAKIKIGHDVLNGISGIKLIARMDVGVPSTLREHFGFADGISRPFIEGEGGSPLPGQGKPFKAGEFVLGYENELGEMAKGPGPEVFWRNGTYISIRKIAQDVLAFRNYLKENGQNDEEQEKVAAKMMGRWRSGCPLALSPDKDSPELVSDKMKNNDFSYLKEDPEGKLTPLGSHIRRVNPRDALDDTATNSRLHRLLRRGAAYGPLLPENATQDDGQARGIIIAFINANPGRQFEFVQSQWVNDGDFIAQGNRTDPFVGRKDKADDYVYPAHPVRKRLMHLPEFTATKGGEHVFLPSIKALQWLASL